MDLGCTNPKRLVARYIKFCTVLPIIFGLVSMELIHDTLLVPGIWGWLQYLKKKNIMNE